MVLTLAGTFGSAIAATDHPTTPNMTSARREYRFG
jgi:hypothetical protein